jgi:hypothetical protein
MRLRTLLVAVAVLAVAFPGVANAQRPADNGFRVTGGGQVIADDTPGPGDTNAFNAHSLGGGQFDSGTYSEDNGSIAARGQYQLIQRAFADTGNGKPVFKLHATVECLVSTGETTARFGGFYSDEDGERTAYAVDVQDNGQQGTDLVYFRDVAVEEDDPENDSPCEADDELEEIQLSRGNLTIHNNPGAS